jgi:hypothetical protein
MNSIQQIMNKLLIVIIIICLLILIGILIKLYKYLYCSNTDNQTPPCNCLIRRINNGIFARGIIEIATIV